MWCLMWFLVDHHFRHVSGIILFRTSASSSSKMTPSPFKSNLQTWRLNRLIRGSPTRRCSFFLIRIPYSYHLAFPFLYQGKGTGMNQTDPRWIWSPISSGWSPPGLLKALARVTSGRLFGSRCDPPAQIGFHNAATKKKKTPWTGVKGIQTNHLLEDFFRRISSRTACWRLFSMTFYKTV